MKNKLLTIQLLVALTLGLFISSCTTTVTIEPTDIKSEIQAENDKFREAFKSGNAAGVAAQYTEDGILYPPNSETMQGQAAITAYWQGAMDAGLSDAELTTVSALAYGDVAVEVGTVNVYVGDQVVDKAKFMVRWKKVDGQWKMYEDIWNSSMPAPAPPAEEEAPAEEESE